ncbi:hypothetical protein Tco_0564592 [Tanacetum coccineum]
MYNSWQSRMFLYINGKKNDRMMIESFKNGPFVYPTIEEDVKIREKEYAELTEQEKVQDDCDFQAINIQVQVNTKILNALQPEWSKFMTDVKLAKNIYNTKFDQFYAYLSQHAGTSNEHEVQGRHSQSFASTENKGNAISSRGNNVAGQARVVKARDSGKELDEEQLVFLADPGVANGQATQTTIPQNAAFQTDDLDAYNSP